MKTVVFDMTCVGWSAIPENTAVYLRLQKDYLNKLLIARRYLYMSDIYRILGVKWNPDDKNICYLAEFGPITIEYESTGEGIFLVKIYQP